MALFVPALLGLAWQGLAEPGLTVQPWDRRGLALALLLLGIDQARMAWVDLQDLAAVRLALTEAQPPRQLRAPAEESAERQRQLDRFAWVTWTTIAIELLGFYGASCSDISLFSASLSLPASVLGWGAALVLLSQLWFHGLAGVQLQPDEAEVVVQFGVRARSPVLIADAVGLGLVGLWLGDRGSGLAATALLAMVVLYGVFKYAEAAIGLARS